MSRSSFPGRFLTDAEREAVTSAVKAAESKTSGEIRVHLDRKAGGDAQAAAKRVFEKIGMDRTEEKNGVLFYLAVADHAFAVIGDSGIDAKVEPEFWEKVSEAMLAAFKQDKFGEGLAAGIAMAGERLAAAFPRKAGDKNELSDDISVGN